MLLKLWSYDRPVSRVMANARLIYFYRNPQHITIRVFCFEIDLPDISIIALLHRKGMGNDRGVCPWFCRFPT